jgi:hypothetical protein
VGGPRVGRVRFSMLFLDFNKKIIIFYQQFLDIL